ncbi:MAG: ComEC/Rec2 family competence protein [bacterium]|nr:ComEC/Rec2 family competence protein [bacterium]
MLTGARIKYLFLICGMIAVWSWQSGPLSPGNSVDSRQASQSAAAPRDYKRATRALIRIERVRKAGRYEALVSTYAAETRVRVRTSKKYGRPRNRNQTRRFRAKYSSRFRMLYNRRAQAALAAPPLRVLLKVNRYDLVAGCTIDARLFGRGVARPLPKNGYGRYLAGRGMSARLELSKRYHLLGVDCSQMTMGGRLHAGLRRILKHNAQLDYTDARYGLVLGLLLGNSGFLQRDLKDRARSLGVAHLFAASGLHLGIFYACLYWPLRRIFGRRDPRALFLPLGPCLLYLIALDAPVSLLRAFCFLASHAAQSLFHRHVPVRQLLVNTALIVLVLAPRDFFQIGTALSFGAVGGILYFSRVLQTTLFAHPRWSKIGGHASVSLAAGVCTVPLIVLFFEQHPALSLPANLLLVPLIAVLLPLIAGGCALTLFVGASIEAAIGSGALPSLNAADPDGSAMQLLDFLVWRPLLGGLDLFLILTEILAYVDGLLALRDGDSPAGWFVYKIRALPLLADAIVVGGALMLRRIQKRAKRSGDPDNPRLLATVRLAIWCGIALLGPPGAWLEFWIARLLA